MGKILTMRVPVRLLKIVIATILTLGLSQPVLAVPGDILFEDDFERATLGADWTISDANLGGINAYPVTTGNSAFTRGDVVTIESLVFDLSPIGGANISLILEKGTDNQGALSEDPDAANEDFVLEYLSSDGITWVQLFLLDAQDVAQEAQTAIDEALPLDALHANFQFRFRQTGGTGGPPANGGIGWDYWHIDDVELVETSGVMAPPPVLSANSCEYFENGLGNWTATGAGNFGTSSATANSPTNSMFLSENAVTLTSDSFDATSVTELTAWIRKGADSFSEDPDGNEDLVFEYSNNGVTWIELDTYEAQGGGSLADGEIVTPSFSAPADFTVSATFQVRFRLLDGDGPGFDFWHVDDVCFDGGMALPTVLKTVVVESDPVNGTTNPKAVPEATLLYSITVTNSGDGSSDQDSIRISDVLDANSTLFVGDLDGSGSPFIFTDGLGNDLSGLAYDYVSLGSLIDSPTFYNSTSTEITPTPDYDPAVRSFDIEMLGQLRPENIGTPEFTITYRVRLD